jgi:gamma-glutamylcyclotransferase (GGCT)/AIG2-like uncharacterized protein YtfP
MPSRDGQAGPVPASNAGEGHFHLFVYGTLRTGGVAAVKLVDCVLAGDAVIEGTLYDLTEFPALLLYGSIPIRGEVWRCPFPLLAVLDEYEGVDRGLFRRVAVMAGEFACWTYVAGPALARQLTPDRRLTHGEWPARVPA